jgi:hypothetical protein
VNLPNPFRMLARLLRRGPVRRTVRRPRLTARLQLLALETRVTPTTGIWNPVTNLSESVRTGYTAGIGTMELLTNGVVLAQGGGVTTGADDLPQELITNAWNLFTPNTSGDSAGSYGTEYTTGAWSAAGGMGTARQYFATNVLPSGKVFVVGENSAAPRALQGTL